MGSSLKKVLTGAYSLRVTKPGCCPHRKPNAGLPVTVFSLCMGSFLFSARDREKGGPLSLILTELWFFILPQCFHTSVQSIWKAPVNDPWQVPAWGWLNNCIQLLNGQLWIPQEFHHLSERESILAYFRFPGSCAELQSSGIPSSKTSVVQSTLVMVWAFVCCRVSLTCHCSHQALETEVCGVPHRSF